MQRVVDAPPSVTTALPELLSAMTGQLSTLIEGLDEEDPETCAELRGLRGQGMALTQTLDAFLRQLLEDHVYWVEREYGLGRRRTDLLVLWRYPGGVQRGVIELKILRDSVEKTLAVGLAQTWEYADRCSADETHLIIFDRRPDRPWTEKIWRRGESHHGRPIMVWGM